MLQNLIKNNILDFLFAIVAYVQGGLWKKQMITSFVKQLKECHTNAICIVFQVNNPELIQEVCFKTYIYYKRLCTGCSTKEAIVISSVKHFIENGENTIQFC